MSLDFSFTLVKSKSNSASLLLLSIINLVASFPTSKFCLNFIPDSFKSLVLLSTTNFSNLKLKLIEISSNLQFKDMNGSTHTDGNSKQVAFILMLCEQDLPKNIGGEFIYKPDNKKVSFKHGRIIQFPADSLHAGMSFNKPNYPRISIKYVGEFYD